LQNIDFLIVFVCWNLKVLGIKEFINICHTEKASSIVVFIMSHGEAAKNSKSANIITADGNKINTD